MAYLNTRSLRFRASASASLSRTPGVAGNKRVVQMRFRVKKCGQGVKQVIFSAGTSNIDELYFDTDDKLKLQIAGSLVLASTKVYRDPAAWIFDIGFLMDVTQGTAANRAELVENSVSVGSYSTDNRASIANADTNINATVIQYIGRDNTGNYFDGYMCDAVMADGGASIAFSTFNATYGLNYPSQPSTTYQTNGFWLPMNDNSALTVSTNVGIGKDSSGNGNFFVSNNMSITAGITNDSLTDTPTSSGTDTGAGGECTGNFPNLNPLNKTSNTTLSNGNLKYVNAAVHCSFNAPFGMFNGKWYWEITTLSPNAAIGIGDASQNFGSYIGSDTHSWGYSHDGNKYFNAVASGYGATLTTNDIVGVAFDAATGSLYFRKNGVWQNSGDPVAGTGYAFTGITSGPIFPAGGLVSGSAEHNFGQRPFANAAPTGYKALCTQNLPTGLSPGLPSTFTGNANANGPYLFVGRSVLTVTINGNVATPGTDFDITVGGMKLRTASASYNASGSNTVSASTYGNDLKYSAAPFVAYVHTWRRDGGRRAYLRR